MATAATKIALAFVMGFGSLAYSHSQSLSYAQSQAFRSWFVKIVEDQLNKPRDPRWHHRDCAGLVRFGVYEAFKTHDASWLKANGMGKAHLPPEVNLSDPQKVLANNWKQTDGKTYSAFANAIGIVQENSRFVSKDINQARPGDLLFFDQGQDQHLMVWMGSYIAYHRGSESKNDQGLRAVTWTQLMNGQDSRWKPSLENPNFIGIYRLSFLSF